MLIICGKKYVNNNKKRKKKGNFETFHKKVDDEEFLILPAKTKF